MPLTLLILLSLLLLVVVLVLVLSTHHVSIAGAQSSVKHVILNEVLLLLCVPLVAVCGVD
jgi:hypothetical protein